MSQPPPSVDPFAPGAPPATPADPGAGHLARLAEEWRQLRRAFAYHPFVEVLPLSGDPPAEYQVNYRVTTLAVGEAGQLAYVTACPVHLWLPPHFPHNAPVLRPMAAVFHPNVAMEWIHLNPPWRPDGCLVDVVSQVGALLAFQSYDPDAVANPLAMNWVYANPHLLPTDPAAGFSPAAGGDPLVRVLRFGPGTLGELRGKLEAAAERLAADPALPPEGLEELAQEVAGALPVFDDPDLPDALRAAAAGVRELADSLAAPDPVWRRIGRQNVLAGAVASAAGEVVKAEEALRRAMGAEAGRYGPADGAGDESGDAGAAPQDGAGGAAAEAVARVPAPAVIQPVALALRRAVRAADQAVADLREKLGELAAAPRVAPPPGTPPGASAAETPLGRLVARELSRLSAAAEPARAAGAWLASLEPVLHRARREAADADRVAAWADHRDLLRRGAELVARVSATAPADLQAYRLAGPGAPAGPFEFEQPCDPGDGGPPVAVWSLRARVVRVVDTATEEVVGRGDGRVELARPGGAGDVAVVVGEHTEELRVQFEYLLAQARDALARLRPPPHDRPRPAAPSTWPARLAAELEDLDAHRLAEAEHRRAADEWKLLAADLAALGRFKQRLATYHLLVRVADFVPRARAERDRLRGAVARADADLADIGARSSRDLESGGMIIPVQYAPQYARLMGERDRARHLAQRLDHSLAGAAERIRLRLAKPRLYGDGEPPRLHVMGPLPPAYAGQQSHLADEAMRQLLARVAGLFGTPFGPPPARADAAPPPGPAPTPEPPPDPAPPAPADPPP